MALNVKVINDQLPQQLDVLRVERLFKDLGVFAASVGILMASLRVEPVRQVTLVCDRMTNRGEGHHVPHVSAQAVCLHDILRPGAVWEPNASGKGRYVGAHCVAVVNSGNMRMVSPR
jgi:hypothetical protein